MKIDPCLDCGALNVRQDNAAQPVVCPKCGGRLLQAEPRTGRDKRLPLADGGDPSQDWRWAS